MKPPSYKVSAGIALLTGCICLATHQWAGAAPSFTCAYLLLRLHKADALLREAHQYWKENEAKKSAPHV